MPCRRSIFPYFVLLSALHAWPATAAVSPATSRNGALDSDRDGIPDRLEDTNRDGTVDEGETDPRHVDSDRDGLPDGFEDRNRDGRVSAGETDPTRRDSDRDGVSDGHEVIVTGTDPLVVDIAPGDRRFALIPEPMVFDLVRGLVSRRGELEVNTLVRFDADGKVHWAPEVEYAIADGVALELELPATGTQPEALKAAVQARLPAPGDAPFVHGTQAIVETALADGATDLSLLWLVGAAPASGVSLLGMAGGRLTVDRSGVSSPRWLLNPSVFVRLDPRVVLGLEGNLTGRADDLEVRLTPQVHWEPANHLRVQLGAGVVTARGSTAPFGALRVIGEL